MSIFYDSVLEFGRKPDIKAYYYPINGHIDECFFDLESNRTAIFRAEMRPYHGVTYDLSWIFDTREFKSFAMSYWEDKKKALALIIALQGVKMINGSTYIENNPLVLRGVFMSLQAFWYEWGYRITWVGWYDSKPVK